MADWSALERRKSPCRLTRWELMVLQLVASGLTDKKIASQLRISRQTVSKHVSNIIGKMGASSRTEAAVLAFREGLVD